MVRARVRGRPAASGTAGRAEGRTDRCKRVCRSGQRSASIPRVRTTGGGGGYLSSTARAAVGTARVLELFQTTPPSWIRPLLTLTSPVDGHGGRGRPAFELGRAEPVDGAVAVPLTWTPDLGEATFSRLVGAFVIAEDGGGTVLTLGGVVEGGEEARSRSTLDAVLRRVVRALEAAYPVG